MAKGGKKAGKLYQTVKFRISPNEAQIAILTRISENLQTLWNDALTQRKEMYENHIALLYRAELVLAPTEDEVKKVREKIKQAFSRYQVSLFDQINRLTARRASDQNFASVPRNWQEETLGTLDGSFKSFANLRSKGDQEARPPGFRKEGSFSEISGRMGFKIRNGEFFLQYNSEGGQSFEFVFDIPEYQEQKLAEAVAIKKFTLYRDERDLTKPGDFWISIAYEIQAVETSEFSPESAVYIALGGSSLGILHPSGELMIDLWRPDKYWEPKIEKVTARAKSCATGSRQWKCRHKARRKMQRIKSRQQKQNHREVVARLLKLGKHFVVTDYPVRSKVGKLADADNPDRGGVLGLNWTAQNTGSFGELALWLKTKVEARGGTFQKHKLHLSEKVDVFGRENKLWVAGQLKASFLASASAKQ
jgi:hypothetical protein